MTATFSVSNGTTTVSFSYKKDTTTVLNKATKVAHYLWNKGYGNHGTEESPILFEDLTNQEKVNLIDDYVLKSILNMAAAYVAELSDLDKIAAVTAENEIVLDDV